jgi:hypothetical protein
MSLLEQAQALEDEARLVIDELALRTTFPWRAQLVGSARSGLMVLRDIDVMFDAPDATAHEILRGLASLSRRVDHLDIDFRDERGDRRPTPAITDERFYAVLKVNGLWKVDLTFWLHVVDRPHVRDALDLRGASEPLRLVILRLKQECPDYPDKISGCDIYTAVLERGVRTVEQLRRI